VNINESIDEATVANETAAKNASRADRSSALAGRSIEVSDPASAQPKRLSCSDQLQGVTATSNGAEIDSPAVHRS
jgi:hypothetical protein